MGSLRRIDLDKLREVAALDDIADDEADGDVELEDAVCVT